MTRWSAVLLLAIVAVAAFLRFDALGQPSYWLDEILGQRVATQAASLPVWEWLRGVHPQHGPLYYATQLLARIAGDDEWAGRLAAACFGLATVPLLFFLCHPEPRRRRRTPNLGEGGPSPSSRLRMTEAVVSALLLAVSPLHVYYSREARPYALIVLLTTAAIAALLARKRVVACVLVALLLYTSLASASAIAAITCVALAISFLERRMWVVAAAGAGALALLPVLYRNGANEPGSPFPGFTLSFFDEIVRGLGVTALESPAGGRTAYVLLAFAVIGAIALIRRNRVHAMIVIAMALLPIAFSAGALAIENHFFAMRYVIAALPAYLVLAGAGIAFVASAFRVAATIVALTMAIAIGVQNWPAARTEAFQKLDWRAIAATIVRHAKPGDLVLAAEAWSGIILDYYFDRQPKKVEDITMTIEPLAERLTNEYPATWLVSGGFSSDTSVRMWMCRYPVVLGSALENFRMHYTSRTGGGFLRERAGPAEWRALDAALDEHGVTLEMTGAEALLLGGGWGGPEGAGTDAFRWTIGERATVSVPRHGKRDRVLQIRVSPLDHPSLPRQTMRIALNGHMLAELTLPANVQEHSVAAPAAAWIDGLNTITFTFGRAVAPVTFDPSNRDERRLAVAFDAITILDAGTSSPKPVGPLSLRLADAFIDEHGAWRRLAPTRFPVQHQRREAVEALLGRLGIDPLALRAGLRLEDLAETVAYGSDCESDRDFILRTYAVLFERAPNEVELRSLLSMLRTGMSRPRVVAHLLKADEFRERVME